MATHLDLEEQEQLDALKHFWNKWGNLITWVLIAVLGAYAAWNGWQYWQRRQAAMAAVLYDEIDRAGAHRLHHGLDRTIGRLHDDRRLDAALAQGGEHAHAVELGHDQIEDDRVEAFAARPAELLERVVAGLGGGDIVAETLEHGVEQAALDGIVVDDENGGGHDTSVAGQWDAESDQRRNRCSVMGHPRSERLSGA